MMCDYDVVEIKWVQLVLIWADGNVLFVVPVIDVLAVKGVCDWYKQTQMTSIIAEPYSVIHLNKLFADPYIFVNFLLYECRKKLFISFCLTVLLQTFRNAWRI